VGADTGRRRDEALAVDAPLLLIAGHDPGDHALKGCGFLLRRKTNVFLHRLKIPLFRR